MAELEVELLKPRVADCVPHLPTAAFFFFQHSAWCVWSVLGDIDPSQEKSHLPGELSHCCGFKAK